MDVAPDDLDFGRLEGFKRLNAGRNRLLAHRDAMARGDWDAAARLAREGTTLFVEGILGAKGELVSSSGEPVRMQFRCDDADWKTLIADYTTGQRPVVDLGQRAYSKAEAEIAGARLLTAFSTAKRLVVGFDSRPIPWATPPAKSYPHVGQCVYCGSQQYSDDPTRRLGNEHIIPQGLGGHLILPRASCKKCEDETSGFEGYCLRRVFGPLRIHRALPSKRLQDRPTTIPVRFGKVGDNPGWVQEVPAEIYPVAVMYPDTGPPLLLDPSGSKDSYQHLIMHNLRSSLDVQARCECIRWLYDQERLSDLGETKLFPLARMFAKMAHCFLVAELGLGAFKPLLADFIRGTDLSRFRDYFGTGDTANSTESATGHLLTREIITIGECRYHGVRIRLFREHNLTEYLDTSRRRRK